MTFEERVRKIMEPELDYIEHRHYDVVSNVEQPVKLGYSLIPPKPELPVYRVSGTETRLVPEDPADPLSTESADEEDEPDRYPSYPSWDNTLKGIKKPGERDWKYQDLINDLLGPRHWFGRFIDNIYGAWESVSEWWDKMENPGKAFWNLLTNPGYLGNGEYPQYQREPLFPDLEWDIYGRPDTPGSGFYYLEEQQPQPAPNVLEYREDVDVADVIEELHTCCSNMRSALEDARVQPWELRDRRRRRP